MPGTPDFSAHANEIIYKEPEYYDFQHAIMPTRMPIKSFCKEYSNLMIRAQRPPLEQIRIIGIANYLLRMPNFLRYFYSLRTSYKHYGTAPTQARGTAGFSKSSSAMPWVERSPATVREARQRVLVRQLYNVSDEPLSTGVPTAMSSE
jgi:hypothetical protein